VYLERELRLMICLSKTNNNEIAGCIDLFEFDIINQRAGIGIVVNKEFRQKGIAKEALSLVQNFAFNQLNINSLWCTISSLNTPSIALFHSCGFIETGKRKQWNKIGENKFSDELFFQHLKPE
jgi:diamine N-acetyltransferase